MKTILVSAYSLQLQMLMTQKGKNSRISRGKQVKLFKQKLFLIISRALIASSSFKLIFDVKCLRDFFFVAFVVF